MKMITNIRPMFNTGKGHNFALPDCVKFILESTGWGEKPDYWDIAAVTGDTVAQVYNQNPSTGCDYCVSGYLAGPEYIGYVFDTLGYDHEYVTAEQLNANTDMYIKKIVDMIDRGIPVLVKTNINDIPGWNADVGTHCVIVGYDCGGQVLKLILDAESTETVDCFISGGNKTDLIFIGDRKREVTLEDIYIAALRRMTHWLTLPERNGKFFGAAAYRKWADDIEAGRFEDANLCLWSNYGVYVCNLATRGGEAAFICGKLADINAKYADLAGLGEKIQELSRTESSTGGRSLLWRQLEEAGGGMDMDRVKMTMRDREQRAKVAALLRDYAERIDRVVELLDAAGRIA